MGRELRQNLKKSLDLRLEKYIKIKYKFRCYSIAKNQKQARFSQIKIGGIKKIK